MTEKNPALVALQGVLTGHPWVGVPPQTVCSACSQAFVLIPRCGAITTLITPQMSRTMKTDRRYSPKFNSERGIPSTTPGFWYGLYLGGYSPTAASQVSYATVEYGGVAFYSRGGIHTASVSPTIDHVTVRNNVVAGMTIGGGLPVILNCDFTNNPAGLINQTPGQPVLAQLNWWNSATGPSGVGPGSGQSVSSGVVFDPWLTATPSYPQYISSVASNFRKFNPSSGAANWSLTSTGASNWTLIISNSSSVVVRTLTASGSTAAFSWDGKNDAGVTQPDGTYSYTIQAVAGGDIATPAAGLVLIDGSLQLSITSPGVAQVLSNVYQNGDANVQVVGAVTMAGLTSWTLEYGPGASPSAWTLISTGTQAVVGGLIGTWATFGLDNGLYSLRLRASDNQGTMIYLLRTHTVAHFKATQSVLQLNAAAGGTVTYTSTVPFALTETLFIKNAAGQTVRTLVNAASRSAGTYTDIWNGRNDTSNPLPDGPYFYIASVTAGTYSMTWDLSTQYLNDFSNYNDGLNIGGWAPFNNRPMTFTYNFAQAGQVSIGLTPNASGPVPNNCDPPNFCLASNKYEESGLHTITWAGVDGAGAFRGDIRHIGVVTQRYVFAKNAVVVYGTKPAVSNVSVTPPVFGPWVGSQTVGFDLATYQNQAATITIRFQNQASLSVLRTITLTGQAPGHRTATWDGRADNGMWVAPGVYTVTVTATDSISNQVSGQILTTIRY